MTTENSNTGEINEARDVWEELWELANSCINWGESDIDKVKFISLAKDEFIVRFIE